MPPALTDALHELEAGTEPLPWSVIEPALRASLGAAYDELLIDITPLAAASLAQVHRARVITSGDEICLKILYPGVKETIDADFNAVVRMLKLTRWLKAGQELDDWLEDMREQLHLEVDYLREARLTEHMASLIAGDARYIVPRVYRKYSSSTVLALSYIAGEPVTSEYVNRLPQTRRNQLAIAAQSVALGGNVRVGLEDSLWIGPGKFAETNAQQVRAARAMIEALGLEIGTQEDARRILQLKGKDRVNF